MAQSMQLTNITDQPITIPALILAGGMGTRLQTVISDRPKTLATIRGKPFLAYLLDWLNAMGLRRAILCTGHLGDQIEAAFGDQYSNVALTYSRETEPRGTAGALRLALSKIDDPLCLVLNGDSFVDADLRAFLDWHIESQRTGSLVLTPMSDVSRFGTVELDEETGEIRAFREKQPDGGSGYINAGVYLLERQLLETIPPEQNVSIERDCFPQWLNRGLGGFVAGTQFIDIGTPESFRQAETFFAAYQSRQPMQTAKLQNDAAQVVRQHIEDSIRTKQQVIERCLDQILAAAALITDTLHRNGKLLLCGNGGSAADAQHLAGEFVSVLSQDFLRPGLPAIALTTDTSIMTASANDFGFAGIFERQVQALGQPGDLLIGISTSGNSENVVRAMQYAHEHDIRTVALTGGTGGEMANLADITICIPANHVQYIQESHIMVAHLLCYLAERALFPDL